MTYHLAQEVEVRLAEASPVTGGMIFGIAGAPRRMDEDLAARPAARFDRGKKGGRPAGRRRR